MSKSMIMRIDNRTVPAAVVMAFLGLVAWAGQGNAQTIINEKGAWQLTALPDTATAQDKFSLSTREGDRTGAKFSLSCRKDVELYYFTVENARPASLRPDVPRFSIRVTNQDPIWFQTALRNGTDIEVRERVHQTAFSIILAQLNQTGAATVEFSAGDRQSTFSLDGFSDLTGSLREHCGYDYYVPSARPERGNP
jgi:hypothetical protein